MTSQLHPSCNPLGFNRESSSNFQRKFCALLLPVQRQEGVEGVDNTIVLWLCCLAQFSSLTSGIQWAQKTGTDMKAWQITQRSKSVSGKAKNGSEHIIASVLRFIYILLFFPSPVLNVLYVCCVILIVTKHTSRDTFPTASMHTIYNNIKGGNLKTACRWS